MKIYFLKKIGCIFSLVMTTLIVVFAISCSVCIAAISAHITKIMPSIHAFVASIELFKLYPAITVIKLAILSMSVSLFFIGIFEKMSRKIDEALNND